MTSEDGENNFASLILLPAPPSQKSHFRNAILGYLARSKVSPSPLKFTFCLSTCCVQDRQHLCAAQVTLFRHWSETAPNKDPQLLSVFRNSPPLSQGKTLYATGQSLHGPVLLKSSKLTYIHTCIFLYNSLRLQDSNQCKPLRWLLTEDTGEETVQRPVVTHLHTYYHMNLVCPQTVPAAFKACQHLLTVMNPWKVMKTIREGKTVIFQHIIWNNSNNIQSVSMYFIQPVFRTYPARFQKDKSSKRRQKQANPHILETSSHILQTVSQKNPLRNLKSPVSECLHFCLSLGM